MASEKRRKTEMPAGEQPAEMLSEEEAQRRMHRLSRRSFLWGGAAVAAAIAGWEWLVTRPEDNGIAWPLRKALHLNAKIAGAYESDNRLAPTLPSAFVTEPLYTGDVGMGDDSDLDNWSLSIIGGRKAGQTLSLAQIKKLPKVDVIAEHKCIEGWSRVVHWTGVRFSDFARAYGPAEMPAYVSLKTPDEEYYVGVDRKAILHPQVLLCYALGGEPLSSDHGAPLRLVMPNRYGIKSLKRIGSIEFTDKRPADYWAEQGYDWYAGL